MPPTVAGMSQLQVIPQSLTDAAGTLRVEQDRVGRAAPALERRAGRHRDGAARRAGRPRWPSRRRRGWRRRSGTPRPSWRLSPPLWVRRRPPIWRWTRTPRPAWSGRVGGRHERRCGAGPAVGRAGCVRSACGACSGSRLTSTGAYERLRGVEAGLDGWRGPAAAQALPRIRRAVSTVSGLAAAVRQVADAVRGGLAGFAEVVRLAGGSPQSPAELAEVVAAATAVDRRVAAALARCRATIPGPRVPDAGIDADSGGGGGVVDRAAHRTSAGSRSQTGRRSSAGSPASRPRCATRPTACSSVACCARCGPSGTGCGRPGSRPVPPELRWVADRVRAGSPSPRPWPGCSAASAPASVARLLTLDLEGAGRVAIGLGDVDRARHVAVVVPGMGQDARHGVERTVANAERLRQQADRDSRRPRPSSPGSAMPRLAGPRCRSPTRALAGGRGLATDLRALAAGRTADGGDPPHLTVDRAQLRQHGRRRGRDHPAADRRRPRAPRQSRRDGRARRPAEPPAGPRLRRRGTVRPGGRPGRLRGRSGRR